MQNKELTELNEKIDSIHNKLKNHQNEIIELKENVNGLARFVNRKDFIGEGRIVKCSHCGYIWKSKTERDKTSCPNCYNIITVDECVIQVEKVKEKEKK